MLPWFGDGDVHGVKGESMSDARFEATVREIGKAILSHMQQDKKGWWRAGRWEDRLLRLCMSHDEFRTQLLRFIDVYPVLTSNEEVVRHLDEYLSGTGMPLIREALSMKNRDYGIRLIAAATRYLARRMAKRFIAGSNIRETMKTVRRLHKAGMGFTVDVLGEKVLSEAEADIYMNVYLDLMDRLSDSNTVKEINVSLKLSSLYSQFDPIDEEGAARKVKDRLRKIFSKAQSVNAFINVDAESYYSLDLAYRIYRELISEDEFRNFDRSGIVIQAYLRDSGKRLEEIIDWIRSEKRKVTVRLVKGAYWDYEIIHARQNGWEIPVFTEKADSDRNFERLTLRLLENADYVTTAIASHNVRSIAHAIAAARMLGVPMDRFELQVLYGMGDVIKNALVTFGYPPRNYIPFGEMIPGMSYLVRRILENTSNESFLRSFQYEHDMDTEEMLRNPATIVPRRRVSAAEAGKTNDRVFRNEPNADFSRDDIREKMRRAIRDIRGRPKDTRPLHIDGRDIETGEILESENPSNLSEIIGRTALAGIQEADDAVRAAADAFREWRNRGYEKRCDCLFTAAQIMRERRYDLAALEILEAGKPWKEADADVCEAIDFIEFYARQMLRLGERRITQRLPGETNSSEYVPRGVAAVIAPWNFPLAIITGMTTAALVTGNTVVMKPAEQTPIIARELMDIYRFAGLPAGVLNYLPGTGETVGRHLVAHPQIATIAFTGSLAVGREILQNAAELKPGQKNFRKVIMELGGKNAVIVDTTADLDEAISGVIASAFGYAGQKCSACSRVIVTEEIYGQFVKRLAEAAESIVMAEAENPAVLAGPVIDGEAREKINGYIEMGGECGRLLYRAQGPFPGGYFVGPTVFADVDQYSPLAQEEIFGPVLAVIRAADFDDAMRIANGTAYGLTAGLYTRTPSHIERFTREVEAGNLYVNRKITGSIVERQPFGGYKMSGIGSKAGGIDYLLQFMIPVSVSENVMRHGFAPLDSEEF